MTDFPAQRGGDAGGLTLLQVRLLAAVAERPHRTVALVTLSDRLDVSPAAVSRAVDHLVVNGFLIRREDPANRRKLLLTITRPALTLVREFGANIVRATRPRPTDERLQQVA